jgi:hypothetical protein
MNKKASYTRLWLLGLFALLAVNTLPLDQIMIGETR